MLHTTRLHEGPRQGLGWEQGSQASFLPPVPPSTSIHFSFVLKICVCVRACVHVCVCEMRGKMEKGFSAVKKGLEMTGLFHLFVL